MCIKKTASKEKRKQGFSFAFGGCFGNLQTKIFRLSNRDDHPYDYLYQKGIFPLVAVYALLQLLQRINQLAMLCCCSVAAVAAYQSTRDALLLLCCSCCSVSIISRCSVSSTSLLYNTREEKEQGQLID
jgi:hypothetical protein